VRPQTRAARAPFHLLHFAFHITTFHDVPRCAVISTIMRTSSGIKGLHAGTTRAGQTGGPHAQERQRYVRWWGRYVVNFVDLRRSCRDRGGIVGECVHVLQPHSMYPTGTGWGSARAVLGIAYLLRSRGHCRLTCGHLCRSSSNVYELPMWCPSELLDSVQVLRFRVAMRAGAYCREPRLQLSRTSSCRRTM
jgi:hypothetical protein